MTHRITNRHKQAKASDSGEPTSAFFKKKATRALRRDPLKTELDSQIERNRSVGSIDHRASRKRSGRCPVCTAALAKNAKGTRYEYRCGECHAVFQRELRCLSCGTNRVWAGSLGRWCKGCGKPVPSERKD